MVRVWKILLAGPERAYYNNWLTCKFSVVYLKEAIATAAKNEKDLYANNFCHPVLVEWFSIQILVHFELFKPS